MILDSAHKLIKKQKAMPIQMCSVFRPLLVCFAILGLSITIVWDRAEGRLEAITASTSENARTLGLSWLAAFVDRLATDRMTLDMLMVLVLVLAYGVLQYGGAHWDGKALRYLAAGRRIGWWRALPGRLIAMLSGRPRAHDTRVLATAEGREIHFTYGRHALLAPLRLALWAFPVVGFLGTVIGISGAVAQLPQVLEDTQALNLLLANLHTAFDTTFVGLAASVLIMLDLHLLDARWDRNELLAFAPREGKATLSIESPAQEEPSPGGLSG